MAEVLLVENSHYTVEQALSLASKMNWERVLVVGFLKDSDELCVVPSDQTSEEALWLAEHLKLQLLGMI